MGGENPGASLPWLVSSLVIICVALAEEAKMKREMGEEYEVYRSSAPFMLPVPRFVSGVIAAPLRVVLKRDRPETGKDLAVTFLIYAVILMVLSVPFLVLDWPQTGWTNWPGLRSQHKPMDHAARERRLTLAECQSLCSAEEYWSGSCLPPAKASSDMVGGGLCSAEGLGDREVKGELRCYCFEKVSVPEGVPSVGDMLEVRAYDEEVIVYGIVSLLGERRCPCFVLMSGAEDVEVWYDGMVDEDGSQGPGVDIDGLKNGDWIVVSGELRQDEGTLPGKGFWASNVKRLK
jgi:hypothetical protein